MSNKGSEVHEDYAVAKNTLIEGRDRRSQQVGTLARNLSYGVLALVWGILVLGEGSELLQERWQHRSLIASGGLAVLALLADWLQAILGYRVYDKALRRTVRDQHPVAAFEEDILYRITEWAFWAKHLLASLGGVVLLVAVVGSLL